MAIFQLTPSNHQILHIGDVALARNVSKYTFSGLVSSEQLIRKIDKIITVWTFEIAARPGNCKLKI